jgi:hypothetical protein
MVGTNNINDADSRIQEVAVNDNQQIDGVTASITESDPTYDPE